MVHEIIRTYCPECSPDEHVAHEIVKDGPGLLIKCTLCNAIHPHGTEKKKMVTLRVVVGYGNTSATRRLSIESDEIISKDDEFIVEDEPSAEVNSILVTSLESDGTRIDSAKASDIQTVWARFTDQVTAKVSITRGWETESIDMDVPGDRLFTIGELIPWKSEQFLIKKIKIRDGGFIKRKGETAAAKHIKRIFADSMERVEWLKRPAKTRKKSAYRSSHGGSIIRKRGSATWTMKRKGDD